MEKNKIQKGGIAYYDNCKFFMFSPDNAVPQSTETYRYRGVAHQMSDGTFQFVPRPSSPKRTRLIKKLAHGRLTETPEGVVRLTLSANRDEGLDLRNAFIGEVIDAFNGRWMEEEPA
ncbi:MAG: hypothetical protein II206_01075 [Bacteroidaceae bacterium]|nr:hypothetical protein [Bacteroidaceae bacterium]